MNLRLSLFLSSFATLALGTTSGCDSGSVGEYDAAGTAGGSSASGEDTRTTGESPNSTADSTSSDGDDDATSTTSPDDDATSTTSTDDDSTSTASTGAEDDPIELDGAVRETCVGKGPSNQSGFSLSIDAVNNECEIIADETEFLQISVAAPFGTVGSFSSDTAEVTHATFHDGALNFYSVESVELEITQWQDDLVVGSYTGVIPAGEDEEFPTPEMMLSGDFVVLACEATARLPCQ